VTRSTTWPPGERHTGERHTGEHGQRHTALRAVATSLGIEVAGGTVRAEGDLDFRGTLAVSREAPVGFTAIRLGHGDHDQLDRREPFKKF
jgi:hypothetical protein